ncbi:MAG: hypothetical protein R2749_25945, partial [Acidimicrobiales bacterium]
MPDTSKIDAQQDKPHSPTDANAGKPSPGHGSGGVHMGYGRFAAMIATSTVVMFGLMYLNTYT